MRTVRFTLTAVTLALFSLATWGTPAMAEDAPQGKLRVYIGTYTGDQSKGIYRCELDLATGKLSDPVLAAEAVNPSFVAIHPNKKFLYAVSEVSDLNGKKTGGVTGFSIEANGNLKQINQQSSGGEGPCHLIVDHGGKHVLVANYGGGNASVLPIDQDGKLAERTGFAQHTDPKRKPLAHSINLDKAGKHAFVCDAGLDKVYIYKYDADKGTITPNDPPAGISPPGAAPRHFALHPDGRHAYAINEAALSVTLFDYNPETGALTPVQTISTVPEGTDRKGLSTAEVVVHPTGKFLYGSNRGYNTIVGYNVDKDGKLTLIGQQAKGAVKVPRNFNVDPTGAYALVEGQDSNNIVVFRINPQTGEYTPTGSSITVGHPVCVKFLAP
jgi:6-phosphogluconolactonase